MEKSNKDDSNSNQVNRSIQVTTPFVSVVISSSSESDDLSKISKLAQELADKYSKSVTGDKSEMSCV